MPREKGAIWQLFDAEPQDGKPHDLAACKACHKKMTGQANRMISHIIARCPSVSPGVRAQWSRFQCSKKRKDRPTPSPHRSKTKQRLASSTPRIPVVSNEANAKFQRDLGLMFYATGLSFRLVENKHFKNFINSYIQGYRLPSRQHLANQVLDDVYETERATVTEVLKSERYVALVTDGWTDPNNCYVMNYIIVTPNHRPLFWRSITIGDQSHDGNLIGSKLLEVIEEIENETMTCRVVGVVTDNASAMKTAWKKVKTKRKDIIFVGCAAHIVNLLLEDIFESPEFEEILNTCRKISKFVKKRTVLLARFRVKQRERFPTAKGRRALSLPVKTRWYSSENCIRNVYQNRKVLKDLLLTDSVTPKLVKKPKLESIRLLLKKDRLWQRMEVIIKLLRPISRALGELESDSGILSTIYKTFRKLIKHPVYHEDDHTIPYGLRRVVHNAIVTRWTQYKDPQINVAFLLDPRHRLSEFLDDDGQTAVDAAITMAETMGYEGRKLRKLEQELYKFVRVKADWKKKDFDRNQKPPRFVWWETSEFLTLKRFAQRVLSVPSSSASSERSWSIFGHIYTKKRNRMDSAVVEKLVFIYSNAGDKHLVLLSFYRKMLMRTDDDSSESEDESGAEDVDDGGEPIVRSLAQDFVDLDDDGDIGNGDESDDLHVQVDSRVDENERVDLDEEGYCTPTGRAPPTWSDSYEPEPDVSGDDASTHEELKAYDETHNVTTSARIDPSSRDQGSLSSLAFSSAARGSATPHLPPFTLFCQTLG